MWNRGERMTSAHREKIGASGLGKRLGPANPAWKGGRSSNSEGYILIRMPEHPHAMPNGYVKEHRLVMERSLGRLLSRSEIVHHINGDKTDNRLVNLELTSQSRHVASHRTGVPRSESTKRRISAARKARFADGELVVHNKGKRRINGRYVDR